MDDLAKVFKWSCFWLQLQTKRFLMSLCTTPTACKWRLQGPPPDMLWSVRGHHNLGVYTDSRPWSVCGQTLLACTL